MSNNNIIPRMHMAPRISILALLALSAGQLYSADLTFRGSMLRVLEETPDKNTGLDKIYIVYDTSGVDLLYTPQNPGFVKVLNYSNLGGGYAEEIKFSVEDGQIVVKNVAGNSGYIIEDGDRRYYYWIVNYLPYKFDIKSISKSDETDCDATVLNVEGEGSPIHYFTINGQQRTLDREITVEYTSQEWDNNISEFTTNDFKKYYESLTNPLRVIPPAYSYTSFVISGDKFLRQWNWVSEAESEVIPPHGILVMSEAIQDGESSGSGGGDSSGSTDSSDASDSSDSNNESTDKEGSNLISSGDSGLGGSAPASISFIGYGTEGVLHNEWQLTTDPNFEDIEYRFNQREIDYTFNDEGTFYLRFVGSNSDGSCEVISDVYIVSIGASELKCPNAFSPDGDGVNDVWKVSYRSLLDFKCWIFDKFGHQIFYFDDPSQGWDGKRGGKTVQPGVYFYVIQATGADNKKYKKSGDINILRHKNSSTGGGVTTDME